MVDSEAVQKALGCYQQLLVVVGPCDGCDWVLGGEDNQCSGLSRQQLSVALAGAK